MKIEMGESLAATWLKHIMGCQIVQTNWKRSPAWSQFHEQEMEGLFTRARQFFGDDLRVFGRNRNVGQIERQAECDVFGVSITNAMPLYYVVETAFHSSGLHYRDSITKVASKMVKAAFVLYNYLGTKRGSIIFATPKVSEVIHHGLETAVVRIQEFFANDELEFEFEFSLITGERFKNDFLEPVKNLKGVVSDTSELFLRAYQLAQFFENENGVIDELGMPLAFDGNEAIGLVVQRDFRRVVEGFHINDVEIAHLQQREYCRETFHLSFPALVRVGSEFDNARYYQDPVLVDGEGFRICSQWKSRNRVALEDWLQQYQNNGMAENDEV